MCGFPKMGVHLNHPFYSDYHLKPSILGNPCVCVTSVRGQMYPAPILGCSVHRFCLSLLFVILIRIGFHEARLFTNSLELHGLLRLRLEWSEGL